jgi:recombination endonuclease VII
MATRRCRIWYKPPSVLRRRPNRDQPLFSQLPIDTIRAKYGFSVLTQSGRNILRTRFIKDQNGICAICRQPFSDAEREPPLDHDHETDTIRAVLCQKCNFGLGSFDDSILRLERAIDYLVLYCHVKPK